MSSHSSKQKLWVDVLTFTPTKSFSMQGVQQRQTHFSFYLSLKYIPQGLQRLLIQHWVECPCEMLHISLTYSPLVVQPVTRPEHRGQICLSCVTTITFFVYVSVHLRQSGLTIMSLMKNLKRLSHLPFPKLYSILHQIYPFLALPSSLLGSY